MFEQNAEYAGDGGAFRLLHLNEVLEYLSTVHGQFVRRIQEQSVVRIVVTSEQAKQLEESLEPIEIVDENGIHVGYLTQPFSRSEILQAKRRSTSETGGRTTAEVLDRLANLETQ